MCTDLFLQGGDLRFQIRIPLNVCGNFIEAVDNCGMIPVSENHPDLLEGGVCHIPAEVHGDLPRIGDLLVPLLPLQVCLSDSVVIRHHLDDELRRDGRNFIRVDHVLQDLLGHFQIDLPVVQPAHGDDPVQGTFQLPDIAADICGNVLNDLIVDVEAVQFLFLL